MSVDDPYISYGEDGRPEWRPPRQQPLPAWVKLIGIALIAGVTIGGPLLFLSRGTGGSETLPVGACFNHPNLDDGTIAPIVIPCTAAHDAEVIAAWSEPNDLSIAYPSLSARSGMIESVCAPAFERYVGQSLAGSELGMGLYFPAMADWQGGARGMMCFLEHRAGDKLTRSVRAAPGIPGEATVGQPL